MNLVWACDLETVKGHYINVIENTPEIEKYARWVYGKHPTDEALRSYIENGEMYLLSDGGTVAGMVAIIMHQGLDYDNIPWTEKLENDQVATLHLLAVCPEYRGRSLGNTILALAGELANKGREQYVLMCWNPTIRPGIYMKRMDLFVGGKSTGTLKTPAGQIFFCMKNHCETMIY